MQHKKQTIQVSILVLIFTIIIQITPGQSCTTEEIFNWVADELQVTNDFPIPQISYVSKEKLQRLFKNNTRQSYQKWSEIYGSDEADRLMNFYLHEVIGFFVPDTQIIYIGSFLDACRLKSIVAHELTHYFQYKIYGKVDPNMIGADQIKLNQEMQAEIIEKRFINMVCPQSEGDMVELGQ